VVWEYVKKNRKNDLRVSKVSVILIHMKHSVAPASYISLVRQTLAARAVAGTVMREDAVLDESPVAVITRIRRGLPVGEFTALAGWLGATEDELALRMGIARATLHRRKKTGQLDASESERLIRLARLMARATEVFESEESARSWLKRPALALAGESPLGFADTEVGAREVEFLLGRLEHGVLS
jgi:putative toxin-antitoxin system antitoxin component (TIGR02293 family)